MNSGIPSIIWVQALEMLVPDAVESTVPVKFLYYDGW